MSGLWHFLFAVVLATALAEEELYSDKYDYIDANEIVTNSRLREQYYNCFMDTAPCQTADAVFFKGNLGEAIVTNCKKCTEKQKKNFSIVVEWYTENRPEQWKALVEKFVNDVKKSGKASEKPV